MTGSKCQYTYKDYLESGYTFKQVYKYLLAAAGGVGVITFTILLIIAVV